MPALAGQVVIVTGASSGIGEATARRLFAAGAKLVVAARRFDRLEALAGELDPGGERLVLVPADLTDEHDRHHLVGEAVVRFGRIDALVNNAGFAVRGPLERVPVDLVRKNFETNIFALVALTQLVLPGMRERRSGRIVLMGSVAGRIARPLTSVYDATKHALEAIADGLRGELKPFGVDVTLIRPGFVLTDFSSAADAASKEVGEDYGPYQPFVEGVRQARHKLRRRAVGPEVIAAAVEKALTVRRPAARYNVPGHAKLFLAANWLLPRGVMAWFMRLRK
ncbi:MAG TPA: SDR family NAD(P)-dependent oxidoreductase [Candidatus Didemnitutus sp.]|nr:SDR family NAD(P)-dependent oxidoreductase [Candidatus Didemnitutus sp.]